VTLKLETLNPIRSFKGRGTEAQAAVRADGNCDGSTRSEGIPTSTRQHRARAVALRFVGGESATRWPVASTAEALALEQSRVLRL
jgi:hypothetical protein